MNGWALAAQIVGALGDLLNLIGGWILALDVLWRPKELKEKKEWAEFAEEFRKAGIPAVYEELKLNDPEALEQGLTLRGVRRGKRGFVLLCVGFSCLLLYRALEIVALYHEKP
jgi:hypothetical protein